MTRRRRPRLPRCAAFVTMLLLGMLGLAVRTPAASPFVYVTTIDTDVVTPVLAQWIDELIKRSERDGAEALVIQLDTPGGLLTATHDIVKDIMTARVPVMVYVAPSGSRAASAGTFITVSAHVAAMAPGTSIGAANVVSIDGSSPADKPKKDEGEGGEQGDAVRELMKALKDAYGEAYGTPDEEETEATDESAAEEAAEDGTEDTSVEAESPTADDGEAVGGEGEPSENTDDPKPEERQQQDTGTAMGDKILNDTIAWARTIAEERGRNADWMERAIVDSASITEDEALELHVIDYVVEDVAELLEVADGREVPLPGRRTVTLHTRGAEQRHLDMTFRYRFLGALAHPQILLLLLSLGGLGITMELFNPNGITGVIGVVCLILAYFGLQTLPINLAGILLLVVALVLLVAEFIVTSYGLLTLGALICFTLGGLMLIDSPDEVLRLQLGDVLPITVALGGIAAFLMALVFRVQRTRPMMGSEGMVGIEGVVTKSLAPVGKIEARGEIWNAEAAGVVPVGARVRVREVHGLTLMVEPTDVDAAATRAVGSHTEGNV